MTGGYVFTGVSFSRRRGGVPPSFHTPILPDGGYPPFFLMGVPHGKGYPPTIGTGWRYPPPNLGRGYPHADLGRGYPSVQIWERGTPPVQTWEGGTPPIQVRLGGGGTPNRNIACTCYAAGGMPIAFTQEDFLVLTMQWLRLRLNDTTKWTYFDTNGTP